ncbi:MAG: amidophosphoribosyltransferase [Candidatus Fibromonas sp.]|jgi:amidophosphoribosyltransferase|nr:amidophosphoribosyltransferase [Candidatus Fibromonas sp.]
MIDELHEECGIMGIFNGDNIVRNLATGLYALQHRGQESAGIAATNGEKVRVSKSMGLVADLVEMGKLEDIAENCFAAVGHVRYSTTGSRTLANAQPMLVSCKWGYLAVAHNGNITNAHELRAEMEANGHIFQSTSDSEVLLHEISRTKADNPAEAIRTAVQKFKGSFCLIFLTIDSMYVIRDGFGFRPLCFGKKNNSWVFASESCAFDLLGVDYLRDVQPGEFLSINKNGIHQEQLIKKSRKAYCIFEFVYFARPDSRIFGQSADKVRRKMGKKLAEESPVDADIIIPCPDSSTTAALGYSHESGICFEIGLLRNHYVGRTFIDPAAQNIREQKVKLKFNTISGVLKDKKVCLVDDSIVRGTTLKIICKMLREAGAKEVHIRIASPPVRFPCCFGMDFPSPAELVANALGTGEVAKMLGVESLHYLSVKGMRECTGAPDDFCGACFDEIYPEEFSNTAKNRCGEVL